MNNEITQELVKELHWMGGLIQMLDVGLVVVDREYKIQMWNMFMENHSGQDATDVVGKNIFECFPALPSEWFKNKIDTVFMLKNRAFTTWEQRGKVFDFKGYRPITSSSDYMHQNITLIPLGGEESEAQQVGILVYDVTDVAITKKALEASNHELAMLGRTDALTKLFNRGYWEEQLIAEFRRYRRTNQTPTLLMFDIDHFKKVNDNYGHPMGDEVIRIVAAVTKKCIRDTDIAGRYGGEEFGVLLVGTPCVGAEAVAERIRKAIEAAPMTHGGQTIHITVSVGACELTEEVASHKEWLERADKALYYSKEHGRNRTTLFSHTLLH